MSTRTLSECLSPLIGKSRLPKAQNALLTDHNNLLRILCQNFEAYHVKVLDTKLSIVRVLESQKNLGHIWSRPRKPLLILTGTEGCPIWYIRILLLIVGLMKLHAPPVPRASKVVDPTKPAVTTIKKRHRHLSLYR
jgi:hypothetical protein